MIQIVSEKKSFELTDEDFKIVQKLLKVALDFEIESYSIFEDMAIYNNLDGIEKAIDEIVNNKDEKELILKINNDKELVDKIQKLIKF